MKMQELCLKIESIVCADIANRGIAALHVPNSLRAAAEALRGKSFVRVPAHDQLFECNFRQVPILTGFPCMHTPMPFENDGPAGALALAAGLGAAGVDAPIVCEMQLADAMRSAIKDRLSDSVFASVHIVGFDPPGAPLRAGDRLPPWPTTAAQSEAWNNILSEADAFIAIERAGPTKDGSCRTMRGRDMAPHVSPLHRAFESARNSGVTTIGIGDGGNELG